RIADGGKRLPLDGGRRGPVGCKRLPPCPEDRMATVADAQPSAWAAALAPAQYFLLRGVDWGTYQTISGALPERHLRFTYDGSNLEFMTTSRLHGRLCRFLG